MLSKIIINNKAKVKKSAKKTIARKKTVNLLRNKLTKMINSSLYGPYAKIGRVISIQDGVAQIIGLLGVKSGEMVAFDNTNILGITLNLENDKVRILIFGEEKYIGQGNLVICLGYIIDTPTGSRLLGRVLNALGEPIDGGDTLTDWPRSRVEVKSPGILLRDSVNESCCTGLKAIDSLIPIGRGQRQLIIGDRQTGKTTIAIDIILNQQNYNPLFESDGGHLFYIYVAIGQKRSTIAQIVTVLKNNGVFKRTIIMGATASDPAALQFLVPYSGCAVAEYFRDREEHAVIFYDDLSKQAVAYRQMSLLLRRPPGREAYPGDIFYLHSRLLERSGKLRTVFINGGSLTAFPVIETQAGDVSAYIATNVISITDGQIFLDEGIFKDGVQPALNTGLSVSRIGAVSQKDSLTLVSGILKIKLASYRLIEGLAVFADDLDDNIKRELVNGIRLVEILKQQKYSPLPVENQILSIYLGISGFLDDILLKNILYFEKCWFVFLYRFILYKVLFIIINFDYTLRNIFRGSAKLIKQTMKKGAYKLPTFQGLDTWRISNLEYKINI